MIKRPLAAIVALVAFVTTDVVPALTPLATNATAQVASLKQEFRAGVFMVELGPGTDVENFLSEHGIDLARASVFHELFAGFSAALTAAEARQIAEDNKVVGIEADQIVRSLADQTTGPTYPGLPRNGLLPWGLDLVDQRSATGDGHFISSSDGSNVKVYVVDTGVNALHADFGARVVDGWSYRTSSSYIASVTASMNTVSAPYSGSCKNVPGYNADHHPLDVDVFDQTVDAADKGKTDNEGHGTHVAGIIGGSLTGVAKNVTIVPVRILNSCGVSTTTVAAAGLEWIVSNHANSEKAVVNMSIGFSPSETFNSVFGYRPCRFERWITGAYDPSNPLSTCRTAPSSWLLAEGVTVVAAAGNSPDVDPCNTAPAATPGSISVASVGSEAVEASYSAYGDCVDIFAPGGSAYVGGGVNSTWHYVKADASNPSTYANEAGTSMAAPHVSGAVALYLQGLTLPADVTTTPSTVWAWLKKQSTCGIVSYTNSSRTTQSPNRLLNIGSAAGVPCAPTGITVTQSAGSSVVTWNDLASPNGSDTISYQVTTTPSTTGCSALQTSLNVATGKLTCTITGLTDGTRYTVSVQATNGVGAGTSGSTSLVAGSSGVETTTTTIAPPVTTIAPPVTTAPVETTTTVAGPVTTVPAVSPTATSPVSAVTSGNSLLLRWPAVISAEAVTYVVSVNPGGVSCSTTSTSCTFIGVSVGTAYSFSIVAKTQSGQVSMPLTYTATAGINQKVTAIKQSSKTLLTKLMTTPSKGKKTYKVTSGKCKIATGRLVAPKTTGSCKVKVSVARSGAYKAMSSVLSLLVV